jgi:hypothetical protein
LKYLLILFVIALALAPLSHFFPSKRQRLMARMREYAAVHGLFVEFRDLPARAGPAPAGRKAQVIYYGKRLPPSRGKGRSPLSWLHSEDGWTGVGHRTPAPVGREQLPVSIEALGVDEGSCGIYWQEQGEETDVEKIVAALEEWAGALSASVKRSQRTDLD